jgi:hypothetical protein
MELQVGKGFTAIGAGVPFFPTETPKFLKERG